MIDPAGPSTTELPEPDRSSLTELGSIARIWRLADHERGQAAIVVALGALSSLLECLSLALFIPLLQILTGHEVALPLPFPDRWLDRLETTGMDVGVVVVLAIIALFVASALVSFSSMALSSSLAMRFAHRLRGRIVASVLTWPVWHVEGFGSARVANSILTESWRACDALCAVLTAIIQGLACGLFVAVLVQLSVEYTFYLLGLTGLSAVVIHRTTHRLKDLGDRAVAANEAYVRRVMDFVHGLKIVRAYGRERFEHDRFERDGQRLTGVFVRMALLGSLVGPLGRILLLLVVGSLVVLAMWRGDDLAIMLGFIVVAYRMHPRVTSIIDQRAKFASVSASVAILERTLAVDAEAGGGTQRFAGLRHGILFDDVGAAYPGITDPALCSVRCRFRKGTLTAIAGHSGAGKSTIVGLLLRFGQPQAGRILVDGVPLTDLSAASWHERVAYVAQDALIFSASVRENIAYGRLDADEAAIRAAAREAQADAFIMRLANGYDTVIGDDGIRLSDGQRQRLALARALVRDPDVLILDEATNALDEPTERAIRRAMSRWRGKRLVIVVAHRFTTIELADHVIVVEQGTVVDEGPPQELAQRCAVYQRLFTDPSFARTDAAT